MTTSNRAFIALVAMTFALGISVVDSVSHGWHAIGVVGLICLVVAIGAELVVIRRSRTN